eukprot:12402481-Prorocentrum_lima.AAC.1
MWSTRHEFRGRVQHVRDCAGKDAVHKHAPTALGIVSNRPIPPCLLGLLRGTPFKECFCCRS